MEFIEMIEMGFYTGFWSLFNPDLTLIMYTCVIVGLALQTVLFVLPFRKKVWRWSLAGLCVLCMVGCDVLWHVITDLRRLTMDMVYGFASCILIGSLLSIAIHYIRKRKALKHVSDDWSV